MAGCRLSVPLAPVLQHLRAEPSRTWSLIITLFGDAVLPRGGELWLGTVLEIFAGLDIGANVVRTAMSRLASDDWLARSRVGRHSYYRLAEKGRSLVAEAATQIYAPTRPAWDGAFRMAVTQGQATGFVPLAPGVLIAPGPAGPAPGVLLRAETDPASARALAAQVWPMARLAESYRRFAAAFRPLTSPAGQALGGHEAVLARLLLIHAFRRVVLHDPMLPEALLPAEWPGHEARTLCAGLYRALLPASERWFDVHGLASAGKLPPPDIRLEDRFVLPISLTSGNLVTYLSALGRA